MNREEFEAGYAARSGLTVAELHDLGMHGEPCDCGDQTCPGWQMVSQVGALRFGGSYDGAPR